MPDVFRSAIARAWCGGPDVVQDALPVQTIEDARDLVTSKVSHTFPWLGIT